MARHSPLALQAAKQALRQSQEVPLQAGLAQERQLFTLLSPPKIAGKASTPSYKNAPPTLKDANCGIYSQSSRTGRNDHYAEPSGASEQL
jgi:enoyl-CoA hydratase